MGVHYKLTMPFPKSNRFNQRSRNARNTLSSSASGDPKATVATKQAWPEPVMEAMINKSVKCTLHILAMLISYISIVQYYCYN